MQVETPTHRDSGDLFPSRSRYCWPTVQEIYPMAFTSASLCRGVQDLLQEKAPVSPVQAYALDSWEVVFPFQLIYYNKIPPAGSWVEITPDSWVLHECLSFP